MASLLTNIAPAYNPNTGAKAGKWYTNGNKLYMCTKDCTGAFNAANFMDKYLSDLMNGNSNLGGQIELLWTNPNLSNSFSAQTINLNLSNYDAVFVEYYAFGDNTYGISRVYIKKDEGYINGGGTITDGRGWGRKAKMTSTGVEFTNGGFDQRTSDNGVARPVRIYGVKGNLFP